MNRISVITFFINLFIASSLLGQDKLTLDDIIQRAQEQSPFSKQAETRKENGYWEYRLFKSNYNPQLRLTGNLPAYNKEIAAIEQNDGTIGFRAIRNTNSRVNLGLIQPISLTGGSVSVNSSVNYFSNLDDASFNAWNGTVYNVQLVQPLFAFNTLKWDKYIEPLRYEESKRSYVEEMESISSQAVDRFFFYLGAQIDLQIANFNLANNDTVYKIEQGRYNIGTTSKDRLLQVELQLLRSKQDVAQANLDLQTRSLQLRSFLGLNEDFGLEFVLPESIPQFEISMEKALESAAKNRSDYIAFERRKLEAEREVAQAKGQRFQADLLASFGANNNAPDYSGIYINPDNQQRANVQLNIPILDWGRNKSRIKTALANKQLNDYVIAQDEIDFEQEVVTLVRQMEVLRLQVEIAKASDNVAQERYSVAQNRYLIGKIDITNLNIALTEKDDAKRGYVNALRLFWKAYYDLRRLTLYDFANDQLLY